mgnify:CR=1 FL=1
MCIRDSFTRVDLRLLATWPELDHNGARRGAGYRGVWNERFGGAPEWPAGEGPRVVAYLKEFPALDALLHLLRRSGLPVLACLGGDATALARFDAEVVRPATEAVRAIDGQAAFVDEARQRVRAHLLVGEGAPRLRDYQGRGPLRAWVGVAAVRTALMMRRSDQRKREVPHDDEWAGTLALVATGNPELDLLKQEHAAAFSQALRDAALALEPRLRAVLSMHFSDGLSIDEIGAVYAVHRATAARWVGRAREELMSQTRALLVDRLGLTPSEIERVGALVQSQVDVSLSQLFAA